LNNADNFQTYLLDGDHFLKLDILKEFGESMPLMIEKLISTIGGGEIDEYTSKNTIQANSE
jgi:hypothetical protein